MSDYKAHTPVVCAMVPRTTRAADPRIDTRCPISLQTAPKTMHDEIDSGLNECRRRTVRMTYEARSFRVHVSTSRWLVGI
ncbi:hypothetical protein WN48_09744 [Eufriesea mexicana]|uniref:Uncharacterized protein n=1 Tax=Eufriesea mexicana TaxID=516756 RepID=A0A310SE05_9HYME|nr:hypothetical protein WN48_09744 [Eufriesea mexicana]